MATCTFCKEQISKGTGKMVVMKDGKIYHFCSSKCEKNFLDLERTPRTTKWTKEYHQIKEGLKE